MISLLIGYIGAYFIPVLFPSWRTAVFALGIQGWLLAMLLLACNETWAGEVLIEFAGLVLIRGVFLPGFLYRKMRGNEAPQDFSLISTNLLQWLLAAGLLLAAFVFGNRMSPHDSLGVVHVATAAGAILIGLQILANQQHPLGQIIGLFTFEGGINLVELLSPHSMPTPVRIGTSVVSVMLILACGNYLTRIDAIRSGEPSATNEEAA